jgi:anti-sigma factor ChrR (cupin superfamily)
VVRYLAFTADERVPPSALRDRLLDRVLIEEASRSPFPATFLAPLWAGRSKQEKRTMTIHSHEGQWQKLMDGVFAKQLFEDKKRGTTTSLVRMAPGSTIEKHLHSALEECFVLEGDFRVNGERLLAGDYHCALPGSIHEKAVTSEGTLLLVITSTNQH